MHIKPIIYLLLLLAILFYPRQASAEYYSWGSWTFAVDNDMRMIIHYSEKNKACISLARLSKNSLIVVGISSVNFKKFKDLKTNFVDIIPQNAKSLNVTLKYIQKGYYAAVLDPEIALKVMLKDFILSVGKSKYRFFSDHNNFLQMTDFMKKMYGSF